MHGPEEATSQRSSDKLKRRFVPEQVAGKFRRQEVIRKKSSSWTNDFHSRRGERLGRIIGPHQAH